MLRTLPAFDKSVPAHALKGKEFSIINGCSLGWHKHLLKNFRLIRLDMCSLMPWFGLNCECYHKSDALGLCKLLL